MVCWNFKGNAARDLPSNSAVAPGPLRHQRSLSSSGNNGKRCKGLAAATIYSIHGRYSSGTSAKEGHQSQKQACSKCGHRADMNVHTTTSQQLVQQEANIDPHVCCVAGHAACLDVAIASQVPMAYRICSTSPMHRAS